jgi:hypothetical protein
MLTAIFAASCDIIVKDFLDSKMCFEMPFL